VARVRLDKRATSVSLLVALGVRADGQKVLLAIKTMGGESEAAWRTLLDDLVRRGLPTPELVIADGAPGLEKALAALWPDTAVQRCTVHKHQWKSIRTSNAIGRLHEEFKRRIKTQTVLPCAETAAMLFWALLACGQITMRKVDGWQTLAEKPDDQIIDLAA
jgi:putative transposase